MSRDNSGPAFPVLDNFGDGTIGCRDMGMSLRDWFAGQAVHGLMIDRPLECPFSDVAAQAYEVADAMLAEREKTR